MGSSGPNPAKIVAAGEAELTNRRYLMMIIHIRPSWTRHFNPPNRTARIQALLRFDECRGPAGDNPDFGIGRLFSYQSRDHAGKAAQFDLQDEKRGFVGSAHDGKVVLA